jgi:hypothetical protein
MDFLDIEDLVKEARADFQKLGEAALFGAALVEFPEFATSDIGKFLIQYFAKEIIDLLLENAEFGAFVLNTQYLESEVARGYREAVAARLQAPEDISDDAWEELERAKNAAFRDLINIAG